MNAQFWSSEQLSHLTNAVFTILALVLLLALADWLDRREK